MFGNHFTIIYTQLFVFLLRATHTCGALMYQGHQKCRKVGPLNGITHLQVVLYLGNGFIVDWG